MTVIKLDNYLHRFCFNNLMLMCFDTIYIRKVLSLFLFLVIQTYNIFLILIIFFKMPNTIEWSEEEMQLLINLRRDRNEDYWRRFGRSKVPFWNEIAAKIQEDLGTAFTGVQVQDKFKGMVKEYKVSK